MATELVAVVHAYAPGHGLVVVVPREVRQRFGYRRGSKFAVFVEPEGKIIYEPIPKEDSNKGGNQ